MDLRRWITGDGWQSIPFPSMTILRLCEVIPFSKSLTLISSYGVAIERRYADIRCTGAMAPPSTIPSTIESTIQRYRIMQLQARVSTPNTIPNQSRVTQVQCKYRTSRTRFVFAGATIFKEGDDSAGIATTPTANNYHTGSAGTKHCANAFTN